MLLFCDSFDHYTTQAQLLLKWSSLVGNNVPSAGNGRGGTAGCALSSAGGGGGFQRKSLPVAASMIVGCGVNFKNDVTLFTWEDSTQGPGEQCSLRWASVSTRLQVFRSGTLLATSAGTYPASVYNFIEFKVMINSVTGSYEVRVNGAVDANLSASGVNTRGVGTNNSTNMLRVGGVAGANTLGAYIDDLYICDLSGAANNDYLGDVRVQALLPNAAGAHSQWTPSGGAVANYTMVDEATPNDDTDYNSDATVGDIDTYAFSDLTPTTGTVKAVQTVIDARKDDAGTRTIAPVVREGGVDYVGPNHNVGTTYAFQMDIYETDPATAAAWAVAAVNGDEFGVKVIA